MRISMPSVPVWHPDTPLPIATLEIAIERICELLSAGKGKTLLLTGAGVSTDSGIRAYRGERGVGERGLWS